MMPGAAVDGLFVLDDLSFDKNHLAVFELGEARIMLIDDLQKALEATKYHWKKLP